MWTRKYLLLLMAGLCSLIVLCGMVWFTLPDGQLRIWFLDVGQGDAVLMRLPAGELVLTDGGPGSVVVQELSEIIPFYEREIELVILSHPHADHLDGLLSVFERYKVRNMLLTGVEYKYIGYARLLELAEEYDVALWYPGEGVDLRIGKVGFDLIYPEGSLVGKGFANVNNSSIVYRVVYGDFIGMFSGDAEEEVEEGLVGRAEGAEDASRPNLKLGADLMKAGHHGSKTSNSEGFVQLVQPETAVISCGVDNQFGHPSVRTLEVFRGVGAEVRRVDLEGRVGELFYPSSKTSKVTTNK